MPLTLHGDRDDTNMFAFMTDFDSPLHSTLHLECDVAHHVFM